MDPDIRPFPRALVSFAPSRLGPGALAGLFAGLVFGIFMQASGLMDVVALALRTESLLLAWVVHLAVATLFGVVFASIADVATMGMGLAWGLAWGVALFGLVGTFLLSTLLARVPEFDAAALWSLAGHALYGLTLGGTYVGLRSRADVADESLWERRARA